LWENPETLARAESSYPLRRIGEPEEIAGMAVLLASRAGNWITGQTIVIDGGATIAGG
jgi:NAD(P)-dependent dehydrogenase (short-subunit alcohol dehydrogenase family)